MSFRGGRGGGRSGGSGGRGGGGRSFGGRGGRGGRGMRDEGPPDVVVGTSFFHHTLMCVYNMVMFNI